MNQGVHRVDSAVPMPSRDYLPYVLSLIDRAERAVLATVFIIDPRPETDLGENVRLLLDTLARAHWRGVDVRVIVGNSSQTPAIELADRVARRYLEGLGVPCRPYAGGGAYGSLHSKYLVVDDVAVVGSHNWSHQALCLDDELSLAVRSKDLSGELRAVFERDWDRAAPRGDEAGGAPASAPAPKPGPQTGPEAPVGIGGGLPRDLEQALIGLATTSHPALALGPTEAAPLASALYRLAALVGGEPLDGGPLADPAGLSAFVVAAADQGLRRHRTGAAAGTADATGGSAAAEPTEPAARMLAEVVAAIKAATLDPAPGGGRAILPEKAAYIGRLSQRAAALKVFADAASGEVDWAGLVSRSAYLDVATRLLRSAQREVKIVMFFMTYRRGGSLPTNLLVEEVAAARRRGCEVTVVLDLDRPGDPYGSRHINLAAYRYLRSQDVNVTWDNRGWVTHTKLLVVDGRDILCGSHNWTAGSLRTYDDQSLVLRSSALAAALTGAQGVTALALPAPQAG